MNGASFIPRASFSFQIGPQGKENDMITIDLSFWAELISVLILMVVLNSILFKPIRRMLEEREAKMAELQAEAEKYERNAEQLVANYDKKLAEARAEGKSELEKLKGEAREEERQLLEAATKEAETKKSELMAELTGQIEAARKELQAQSDAFAVEVAQKLLGRAV